MKIYFDLPKVSFNEWNTMHWAKRDKLTKLYHEDIFYQCKSNKIERFTKPVTIKFGFNTRFDLDNNAPMIKMIIDSVKCSKVIHDDSKKYFRKLTTEVSNHNWFEIKERFSGKTLLDKLYEAYSKIEKKTDDIAYLNGFHAAIDLIIEEIDKIEEIEELK